MFYLLGVFFSNFVFFFFKMTLDSVLTGRKRRPSEKYVFLNVAKEYRDADLAEREEAGKPLAQGTIDNMDQRIGVIGRYLDEDIRTLTTI